MSKQPIDLRSARILLSNDDGIHAPGLKLLHKVVRNLCRDVWVVAPETEQSAAGHSLTLRRPLRIRKLGAKRFAVDGTPTDSVLLALTEVMKNKPPDLLLSGINRGGNMGEDVTYSGTVAAAMEATLLKVPAVALSQNAQAGKPTRWMTAEHHAAKVIEKLATLSWPETVFINVNFPDVAASAVTGIRMTSQGRRKPGGALARGVDPRGEPYYWISTARVETTPKRDSDLAAIYDGAIAVTPMHLDLTHRATLRAFRKAVP